MVILTSNRLDVETRKAYKIQLKADVLSKWNEMLQFIQQRCHTLVSIEKRNNGAPLEVKFIHNKIVISKVQKTEPN
jgi:hypothetical protein